MGRGGYRPVAARGAKTDNRLSVSAARVQCQMFLSACQPDRLDALTAEILVKWYRLKPKECDTLLTAAKERRSADARLL